jgi:hypothetical protein
MSTLHQVYQGVLTAIKILSMGLIVSILGLELWNLGIPGVNPHPIPSLGSPLLTMGRVVVALHGIEGIIAAVWAGTRQKNPLTYGVYTFFVGFVGLVELWTGPKTHGQPD